LPSVGSGVRFSSLPTKMHLQNIGSVSPTKRH
jgi:hypothetical protein